MSEQSIKKAARFSKKDGELFGKDGGLFRKDGGLLIEIDRRSLISIEK